MLRIKFTFLSPFDDDFNVIAGLMGKTATEAAILHYCGI